MKGNNMLPAYRNSSLSTGVQTKFRMCQQRLMPDFWFKELIWHLLTQELCFPLVSFFSILMIEKRAGNQVSFDLSQEQMAS
jgi:hypothetical protein